MMGGSLDCHAAFGGSQRRGRDGLTAKHAKYAKKTGEGTIHCREMQTSSVRLREPPKVAWRSGFNIYYYVFYADYYDKVRNRWIATLARHAYARG